MILQHVRVGPTWPILGIAPIGVDEIDAGSAAPSADDPSANTQSDRVLPCNLWHGRLLIARNNKEELVRWFDRSLVSLSRCVGRGMSPTDDYVSRAGPGLSHSLETASPMDCCLRRRRRHIWPDNLA
jgi:hypothetical protein